MILQEAIKSGKPFKTETMLDYIYVKENRFTWMSVNQIVGIFPVHYVLSEDWYLYEAPKNVLKFPIKKIPPYTPSTAS